jgi:hypothetical protein
MAHHQKKTGTPDTRVHSGEGKKSAMWHVPDASATDCLP